MLSRAKKDNKGYSLVELIVAMLVTSVVMLAAVGFITTAINSYRSTNAEAAIQIEAQVASNTITDIIISASECQFEEAAVSGTQCKLLSILNNNEYYVIMLDIADNKLRLKKLAMSEAVMNDITGGINAAATAEIFNMAGNDKMLLASYAADMNVYGIDTSLIQLELRFEFDGKSYVGNYMINRRND